MNSCLHKNIRRLKNVNRKYAESFKSWWWKRFKASCPQGSNHKHTQMIRITSTSIWMPESSKEMVQGTQNGIWAYLQELPKDIFLLNIRLDNIEATVEQSYK